MAASLGRLQILSGAAGLAAGSFLGLLIGLSRSPIVGAAITVLVPVVGFFASGLSRSKDQNPIVSLQDTLTFILTFFLAALVSLSLGLWIRTSSTPIIAFKGDLLAAGFSEAASKEIVAESLKKGTLIPSNTTAVGFYSSKPPEATPALQPIAPSPTNCTKFDPGSPPYSNDAIEKMRVADVPAWRDAAELLQAISRIPAADSAVTVQLHTKIRRFVCGD